MLVQAVQHELLSFGCFFLVNMLILSLPLLGLGSKSTSFSSGLCVCRPRQYNTICWKLDLIGWMKSRHVVGVLQEVGNADSGARTKCQV